jgi:hypothetical protein
MHNGGIVLFMVLGAMLAIFARPSTLWSLRWVFSSQQLAERNQPGHRRLRLFYRFGVAGHIGLGLFFFVAGVVVLLK